MAGTPIALIDYGAGNLTSVRKGFAAIGAELVTPQSPADLAGARAIVVPGVGHFQATSPLGGEWKTAILVSVERFHRADEHVGYQVLRLVFRAGPRQAIPKDRVAIAFVELPER